jgi:hypothetical protein
MKFFDLSNKKHITIPDSKVKITTKIVNTKSNLGKRKIEIATAVSPKGTKLSKIVSNKKA